tara:strand:- start:565 stop:891 length:327 start_codon:yes stop_codon:yes gene_type:complete
MTKTITVVVDLKQMKELKSITLRQDLKKLLEYGFTAKSMSKYMNNQISDRAIREFINNKRRSLISDNFDVLSQWTSKVLEEIEKLEEPISYTDYYLDAINGEKNETDT